MEKYDVIVAINDSVKKIYKDEISLHLKQFDSDYYKLYKNLLFEVLNEEIWRILNKTFVYEFHEFRKKEKIPISSSNTAFNMFANVINENMINNWFEKYPMLKEILDNVIKNNCNYITQVINNYKKDKTNLLFNGIILQNDNICKIKSVNSDPHNGSKRVILFEFESGNKVLYKPHSLNIDMLISKLFDLLIEKSQYDFLNPVPKILCRKNYGWQSYVKQKELDEENLKSAYFKLGFFSSLFSSIISTDIHDENLIFNDTNPYFIDLETSLTPENNIENSLNESFSKELSHSIVGTSIVPSKIPMNSYQIMLGALNTPYPQKTSQKVFQMIDFGTDKMDIAKSELSVERIANPIKLKTNLINDPLPYQKNFENGFDMGTNIIIDNKKQLTNLLKTFKGNVRFIFRPTVKYYAILDACLFPENLINRSTLDKVLNYLTVSKIASGNPKIGLEILQKEKDSLKSADIPYFYVEGNSNNVRTENYISDYFFDISPIENAVQSIDSLSRKWLLFNERLISEGFSNIRNSEEKFTKKNQYFDNIKIFKDILNEVGNNNIDNAMKIFIEFSVFNKSKSKIGWLNGVYGDFPFSYMSNGFCSFYDSGGILALFSHLDSKYDELYKKTSHGLKELYDLLNKNNLTNSIISNSESLDYLFNYKENRIPSIENKILNSSENNNKDLFMGNLGLYLLLATFEETPKNIFKMKNLVNDNIVNKFGIAHGVLGELWSKFRVEFYLGNIKKCNLLLDESFMLLDEANKNGNGWCNGLSGWLMVVYEMSIMLGKNTTFKNRIIDYIVSFDENEPVDISVCHGISGILQTLLFIYNTCKDKKILDIANNFWEKSIESAQKNGFYTGIKRNDYILGYFIGWSGFIDTAIILNNINKNNEYMWIPINLSSNNYQKNLIMRG
ncbi:type 2 lanthipeptide synthetase LanM [Fructilactobacillus sanfranciscensis]|uniref:type 2 lanthipeptide synthetase LanM n=1 Tax=Fructilactobacillus sanfranciscensis TaxID=1625 RepID=UPI001117FEC6|nr:type 2 lanthipeptide synthetase LanM [Fructilactobacillus sanfranciscensis]MVF16000.1 type 2 lantipeptide synthetase LanM [Fructilactobacillus sanfranciscensis]TNK95154.1 hypothetical protein DKP74_06210 [Fructilactobacillus sanfranciscensis]TNK97078.1 hypothetical protein DKP75_05595 [Fructilactobacillus sanfranciscensis]